MTSPTLEDLAILVDEYNLARTTRLAAAKEVTKLEEGEHTLKAQLIALIKEAGATSVGGKTAIVKVTIKNEPTLDSWDELCTHIRITGEFELLYRRVNAKSVKDRWDLQQTVPGIGSYPVESLSISQVK